MPAYLFWFTCRTPPVSAPLYARRLLHASALQRRRFLSHAAVSPLAFTAGRTTTCTFWRVSSFCDHLLTCDMWRGRLEDHMAGLKADGTLFPFGLGGRRTATSLTTRHRYFAAFLLFTCVSLRTALPCLLFSAVDQTTWAAHHPSHTMRPYRYSKPHLLRGTLLCCGYASGRMRTRLPRIPTTCCGYGLFAWKEGGARFGCRRFGRFAALATPDVPVCACRTHTHLLLRRAILDALRTNHAADGHQRDRRRRKPGRSLLASGRDFPAGRNCLPWRALCAFGVYVKHGGTAFSADPALHPRRCPATTWPACPLPLRRARSFAVGCPLLAFFIVQRDWAVSPLYTSSLRVSGKEKRDVSHFWRYLR
jgi:hypothetical protein